MHRYIYKVFIIAAAVCILATGCINSSEDCPAGSNTAVFNFRYDHNMEGTDLFDRQVRHIELFIYNEAGRLEGRVSCPQAEMGNGCSVTASLKEGKYTAVAWGNCASGHYSFHDTDNISTLNVTFDHIDGDIVLSNDFDMLFHGSTTFEISGLNAEVPVSLTKNTNTLRFVITGLTAEYAGLVPDNFDLTVSGSHRTYDAANNHVPGQLITHYPNLAADGSDIIGECRVLRLFEEDRDMSVRLYIKHLETGNEFIFERPVIPMLLGQREAGSPYTGSEYLDRQDLFIIPVVIGTDGSGNLVIEEWDLIDQPEELG